MATPCLHHFTKPFKVMYTCIITNEDWIALRIWIHSCQKHFYICMEFFSCPRPGQDVQMKDTIEGNCRENGVSSRICHKLCNHAVVLIVQFKPTPFDIWCCSVTCCFIKEDKSPWWIILANCCLEDSSESIITFTSRSANLDDKWMLTSTDPQLFSL